MQDFYTFIFNQFINIYNFFVSTWWLSVILLIWILQLVINLIVNLYGRKE